MEDTGLAATALGMAEAFWKAEHGRDPTVSEWPAFLELVRGCSNALQGKAAPYKYDLAKLVG